MAKFQFEWWMAIIALGVIYLLASYGQGQWLNPIQNSYACSWENQSGVCIDNQGSPSSLTGPKQGYAGTDAQIFIGVYDTSDANQQQAVNDKLAAFNTALSNAGVGVGSPCQVKVGWSIGANFVGGGMTVSSSNALPASYYPAGAPPGTWLSGTLIQNTAPSATTVGIYNLETNTGHVVFKGIIPYICRTNYTYPTIGYPSTVTSGEWTASTAAVISDVNVRIYKSNACRTAADANCDGKVVKGELVNYLQLYINNQVSRAQLLNVLQVWIDDGGQ